MLILGLVCVDVKIRTGKTHLIFHGKFIIEKEKTYKTRKKDFDAKVREERLWNGEGVRRLRSK